MKLPEGSALKGLAQIALAVYAALVLKVVLFKHPAGLSALKGLSLERLQFRLVHATNLTPLKTILLYVRTYEGSRAALWNLAGNLALLGPLGFLLPLVFPRVRSLRQIVVIAFAVSLLLEVVQLLAGLGSFDIDDLILNVVGAVLGLLVHRGVLVLWGRRGPIEDDGA